MHTHMSYIRVSSLEIGPLAYGDSSHHKQRTLYVRYHGGGQDAITLVGPTVDILLEPEDRTVELYRRIEDLEREVVRLRAALGGEVGA